MKRLWDQVADPALVLLLTLLIALFVGFHGRSAFWPPSRRPRSGSSRPASSRPSSPSGAGRRRRHRAAERLKCDEQLLGDGLDQRLGMAILVESRELRRGVARHVAKTLELPPCLEGGELGVAEDGRLHLGKRQLEAGVAGTAGRLEQRAPHTGQHLPVGVERVQVALRDAAAQMSIDILQILGLACCRCSAAG